MPVSFERPRSGSDRRNRRVAVIDIGSNSMRLVVYDGLGRAPLPLFNEKIMCGLGRTVGKTNRLNPDGVSLALDNLGRFRRLLEGMDVEQVDIIATAAVRDAEDGAEFVERVRAETGLEVRTISGAEEARLSAMGVLSGAPEADGLMGDLGGGSLEVVGLERGVIGSEQVTLPLGPLRLGDAGNGRLDKVQKTIDQHLDGQSWIKAYKGRGFYPVGGSWRALAKLHMEQTNHALHIIHEYTVEAASLCDFLAVIARQSRSSLEKMSGVSRRRIDTLPIAALVMERLIRHLEPRKVVFSAYGLREGLLFDLLTPEERCRDPLLSACAALAHRLGRFGVGDFLTGWTAALFPGEDAAIARLRQAACLLSDLGWAEHPDYRAEHAFLRILRMPFAGIDHHERAWLALAAYVRYGGRSDDARTAVARSLLSDGQTAKAEVLGLALRLALTLTGGVTTLLQRTALRLGDEALTLALPEDGRVLVGDAVQRRLDALARSVGRKGVISYQPRPVG
jgi:exopolyphosphatase / guanosine-5'-triphosphate,3'-diphosphate pyrophosphatase